MLRTGILLALLSAALFGASTPLAKLLLGAVDPWMMAGLLYLGAGIGLAAIHLSRQVLRLPAIEASLRRSDLPWLALVILAGGIFGPLLLMFGLSRTQASGASLLLNLEGLASMGIAWVVFRENVDRRLLLGAGAILAGAVLLSWQGQASFRWGAVLIAAACLCWGIDNNLTRRLSSADPVQIAMLKGLVAGAVNFSLAQVHGAALPGAGTILAAGAVGFLGYGVSLALFVLGLRHLGTARTGAYFSLAPFVGAVLAVLLLGEPLSARLLLAGGLMGLGLWLHLSERHDHEHVHEALEHEHRHTHEAHHQHAHAPGRAARGAAHALAPTCSPGASPPALSRSAPSTRSRQLKAYAACRRDLRPARTSPRTPRPSNGALAGSGTGVPMAVVSQPPVSMDTIFVSRVTAPLRARARPHSMVAPVTRVMLLSARIFPANAVPEPRVAELPTCQKTLSPAPPLAKTTDEWLAVVRVLPIWNRNTAFGSPSASSVSVPVNCADEAKLYTPGVRVRPPRSTPVRSIPPNSPAAKL